MRAEIDAGMARDEVLSRHGQSVEDWLAVQTQFLQAMGAELEAGRMELTNRYTQRFVAHQSSLAPVLAPAVEEAPAPPPPADALGMTQGVGMKALVIDDLPFAGQAAAPAPVELGPSEDAGATQDVFQALTDAQLFGQPAPEPPPPSVPQPVPPPPPSVPQAPAAPPPVAAPLPVEPAVVDESSVDGTGFISADLLAAPATPFAESSAAPSRPGPAPTGGTPFSPSAVDGTAFVGALTDEQIMPFEGEGTAPAPLSPEETASLQQDAGATSFVSALEIDPAEIARAASSPDHPPLSPQRYAELKLRTDGKPPAERAAVHTTFAIADEAARERIDETMRTYFQQNEEGRGYYQQWLGYYRKQGL